MDNFVAMLRDMFEEAETKRNSSFDESLINRKDVECRSDLRYGTDEKIHTMDIFYPKYSGDNMLPVLINVHGGGWIYGSKEGYRPYCMMLASWGFAVVSFNYRLVPEGYYPDPLEDMNTLMDWIYRHSKEYRLDTERIYGIGDSAGAHILGNYAAICCNSEYASRFPFQPVIENPFSAVVLNCGVYYADLDKYATDFVQIIAKAYLKIPRKKEKAGWTWKKEQEAKVRTDLFEFAKYITGEYPPVFVMGAADDFAKMHSAKLVEKLVENSVDTVFRLFSSKTRRMEHVFHGDLMTDEAKQCNEEERIFLKKMEQRYEKSHACNGTDR